MTKNISITLDQDLLEYLDELAKINNRTRSGMISYLIKQSYLEDINTDLNAQEAIYSDTDSCKDVEENVPEFYRVFYRVHVKIDDDSAHLAFDFPDRQIASAFADQAYMACDLYKVWTEIVVKEVTTTESTM